MNRRLMLALSAALALAGPVAAQTSATPLAARDWTIGAQRSLKDAPPSKADVLAFLGTRVAAGGQVCSFGLVDLAHDGAYTLVASVDHSGRHFCNTVVVASKAGGTFRFQTVPGWQVDSIAAGVVRSLGHDGQRRLVIPTALSDYEGAACVASWSRIYRVENGALVEDTKAHPAFYRARLSELGASGDAASAVCRTMEADKLGRVLGVSPTAGFEAAAQWRRSPDPALRRKAARVFADIGDGRSIEMLQSMMRDKDRLTARRASGLLEEMGAR